MESLRQMSAPHFTPSAHTRPASRKLPTPRTRFFWWYSLTLLFLGPFGFVVGPLLARRATRKATLRYPVEAYAAQARDVGFAWWQWWVMTPMTLLGAFWVFGLLSGLPMIVFVFYAQLAQ